MLRAGRDGLAQVRPSAVEKPVLGKLITDIRKVGGAYEADLDP
jgi:hypothetical protein